MEYLDYLADYTYDELPQSVRSSISREAYAERRQMVLAVQEPEETALPPALAAAFTAHTQVQGQAAGSNVRWLPWLAAAGWLLFLGASGLLLLREPETLLVEKNTTAPAAAAPAELAEVPEIIYSTDTLYQTVIRYRDRIETVIVHDTVYQELAVDRLVYLTDTLYLPAADPALPVSGSSSLAGKKKVLSFLFATE